MRTPENWEQMAEDERQMWLYANATPACRFSTRKKEAGKRLARLIVEDKELSKVKVIELHSVFDYAEAYLKIMYGQASLRQSLDIFEKLTEDDTSYPGTAVPR